MHITSPVFAAVAPHRLLNRSHRSCPFMCTSSASYFPHSTTIPASVPKVIYSWLNTLLILMYSKSFCTQCLSITGYPHLIHSLYFFFFLTSVPFLLNLLRNHAYVWHQVNDRNHKIYIYLAPMTCRDLTEATM